MTITLRQRLGHSLEQGYASRLFCREALAKTVLAYELLNALHGNHAGTATPNKNQELTAVQVCIALSLTNGSTCPKVEDHGTKEML